MCVQDRLDVVVPVLSIFQEVFACALLTLELQIAGEGDEVPAGSTVLSVSERYMSADIVDNDRAEVPKVCQVTLL